MEEGGAAGGGFDVFDIKKKFGVGDRALILSGCIVLLYAFTRCLSTERLGNSPGWIDDMVLATAGIVVCSWHEKGNVVILLADV